MISDSERREVARRLREYVDLPDDWWADTYSGFYVEKCVFGDVERHRESELFDRLADLIEPVFDMLYVTYSRSTCGPNGRAYMVKVRHRTKGWERDFYAVDRDALLALADRMEHMAGMGALLAAHGLAMAAASIREACGEVEE